MFGFFSYFYFYFCFKFIYFFLTLLLFKIKFYVAFVLAVLPVFGSQNGSFSFGFVSFLLILFFCRLQAFVYLFTRKCENCVKYCLTKF